MEKITINDWEYHVRMLTDIANRNKGTLLLAYDPDLKNEKSKTARAIVADGRDFIVMMAMLIDDITKDTGFSPVAVVELLSEMVKMAHKENSHD